MKKILFFASFVLIANLAFSQVAFSDEDGNEYSNGESIGLPIEGEGVELWIKNKSGSTQNFILEISAIDIPENTSFEICVDGGSCVIGLVTTGVVGNEIEVETTKKIHINYITLGENLDGKLTLKVANRNDPNDTASISLDTHLGLAEQAKTNIQIHPNPATEYINVSFAESINETIFIFDMLGKNISEIPTQGRNNVKVDLISYPKGIYLLKVGNVCKKFIIK